MLHRRNLLAAGLVAPLVSAGNAWAMGEADARLLVVFLRGAYDAANVVIPIDNSRYYEARPHLSIARPNPKDPSAALPLDANWGLHPALRTTIYPLWLKRQVLFVPFAGTDDMTRSHFETQDTIELGQPVGRSRNYRSGFLGRLNAEISNLHSISFTDQLPLIFQGDQMIPNLGISTLGRPPMDSRQSNLIEGMYRGQSLQASVEAGFKVRSDAYQSIAQEGAAANRGAISARGFELAARQIARLMRADYRLAFVDVGGWDTHVNQGAATGFLAGRLTELGQGLAGFADELGAEVWGRTVVVVLSEFGRTFRENGDRGTDHGHGSTYWIMGGGISGGRVAGEQVQLTPATLNQGRDYPVLTDYRALLGGIFSRMYGLDARGLDRIFPGANSMDLGII